MITTTAFQNMLSNDEDLLKRNFVKKLKHCDEAVMDQELLKNFHDRETEHTH